MKKRGHSDTKTRAKSSSAVTSIPPRLTLFGQPQLLEGEDAAAYDQLLARIRAVVKPIDIIDEMFSVDYKINQLLANRIPPGIEGIMRLARARKAGELVQEYVRRESDAVTLIDELLTSGGKSMDTLIAEALAEELNHIERIDRLTAIAESRRNASLREIDRRRAVLGETLRRSVQEIEDAEFKVVVCRHHEMLAGRGFSFAFVASGAATAARSRRVRIPCTPGVRPPA
jgi:hypothetical protein